jgi:ankyrin repeat protein
LHNAIKGGNTSLVNLLLEYKADVNATNKYIDMFGETMASAITSLLIKKHGGDTNATNEYCGDTPLHNAIKGGNTSIIMSLLEHGADINATDKYGNTHLHNAINGGNNSIITLLLEHGADVNATYKYDNTPLYNAIKGGNTSVVTLLLEHGANVNITNRYGDTPLHNAINGENTSIITSLLKQGANINATNKYGKTPFPEVIKGGNISLIKLFLENGADVNTTDIYGETVLLRAAQLEHHETVKLLIENGADLSVNKNNQNIFSFYPPDGNNIEIFDLLLEYGADYALVRRGDDVRNLATSSQSAHNVKLISQLYPKLVTKEVADNLLANKQQLTDQCKDLLRKYPISTPEFIKLFLDLIKHKFDDCQNPEILQGDKFIKDLLAASQSPIKFDDIKNGIIKFDNVKEQFNIFLISSNAKPYFNDLCDKATSLVDNLFGNPSTNMSDVQIEPSLLIPLIMSKLKNSVIGSLIIELIDAATRYASGDKSCLGGQLNKLATLLVGIDDQGVTDPQKHKGQFEFEGFTINYNALLEETFAIAGSNKSTDLTNLEAQNLRKAIYKIMKGDYNDNFTKIFCYSGSTEVVSNVFNNAHNIAEFKQQLTYELIFKVQQEVLKKSPAGYHIPEKLLPVTESDLATIIVPAIKDPRMESLKLKADILAQISKIFGENNNIEDKFLEKYSANELKIADLKMLKEYFSDSNAFKGQLEKLVGVNEVDAKPNNIAANDNIAGNDSIQVIGANDPVHESISLVNNLLGPVNDVNNPLDLAGDHLDNLAGGESVSLVKIPDNGNQQDLQPLLAQNEELHGANDNIEMLGNNANEGHSS